MRVHRFDDAPRPMSWLPNREGFRFIAVFIDGTDTEARVERRADGTHVAVYEFCGLKSLKGWLPMPAVRVA